MLGPILCGPVTQWDLLAGAIFFQEDKEKDFNNESAPSNICIIIIGFVVAINARNLFYLFLYLKSYYYFFLLKIIRYFDYNIDF